MVRVVSQGIKAELRRVVGMVAGMELPGGSRFSFTFGLLLRLISICVVVLFHSLT